jgi:GTP cyclohydrolase IA
MIYDQADESYDHLHHLEMAWQEILTGLGVKPTPGMVDTPRRAAKALIELTTGYQVDVPGLFTTFEKDGYDEMVVLRDIEFSSLCEHHVLPFTGRTHIAYVPQDRVVGLSKLARLVEAFSRRLQIQERMTEEIADALWSHLEPRGVMVVVQATHTCMALRGVRKPGAVMFTSASRGKMWKPEVRAEAMGLLLGHHV